MAALRQVFPYPDRLQVFTAARSLLDLESLCDRIRTDWIDLESQGVAMAQQAYLLHDLFGESPMEFDHLMGGWLMEGYGATLEDLNWPYSESDYEEHGL